MMVVIKMVYGEMKMHDIGKKAKATVVIVVIKSCMETTNTDAMVVVVVKFLQRQ